MPHGKLVRANVGLTRKWQLFKTPVAPSDTLLTTLNRPATLENDAAQVQGVHRVRARFFGQDTNNETVSTLQLSGWYEDGPGQLIATMSMVLGNHQPSADFPGGMSPQIQAAFAFAGAWFEVDSFSALAGPESANVTIVNNADSGSYFDYDNEKTMYEYILALINAGTAARCGGIWMPNG